MDGKSNAKRVGISPRVRATVNVLLLAVLIIVSVGTASGVLPFFVVGAAITGGLVAQFWIADRKSSTAATGRFRWWKRRERGAFYTSWWVLVLLSGILIRTVSVEGMGLRTALVLGIMAAPLWVILRSPPERPWDPGRLTK